MYFAPFEKNLAVWTGIFVKRVCGIKLQIEILHLQKSFFKFLEFLSVAICHKGLFTYVDLQIWPF